MSWQQVLRTNFTKMGALADFLELSPSNRRHLLTSPFPLNLPHRLARKMEKDNLRDPLFLQFVPLTAEAVATGIKDPVQECAFQKAPKLLHKYRGRALLMPTSACAMHCRYCFRRHFPYASSSALSEEIAYFKSHPDLFEVILSGGDPLSLPDATLTSFIHELEAIPHLRILRFHTRFPIGIPERITPDFLALLASTRFQTVFVVHINHPRELDADIVQALQAIHRLGIPLLSQSVLLRGVNDTTLILKELCLSLVSAGIIPYYLHQLDPVEGGLHFEVPIAEGKRLLRTLQQEMPGYAIPRYVQEIAHRTSKTQM